MSVAGGMGITALAILAKRTHGWPAGLALSAGAVLSVAYVTASDIKRCVVDQVSWRDRHPVVHWLIPRHPLD